MVEPLYSRLLDISYQFDPELNKGFYYISHSTPHGHYIGGKFFQNSLDLNTYIDEMGLSSYFTQIKKNFSHIIEKLSNLKLTSPIGLDAFIYKTDQAIELYPLCDINYRITMGSLLHSLVKFLPLGGVAEILSVKTSLGTNRYKLFTYNKERKEGVIILSPDFTNALTVLIVANSLSDLEKIKNGFYKIIFLHPINKRLINI